MFAYTEFDTQVLSLLALMSDDWMLSPTGMHHDEVGSFALSLHGLGMQVDVRHRNGELIFPNNTARRYRQLSLRGQLRARQEHRRLLHRALPALPTTSTLEAAMSGRVAVQGLTATEVLARNAQHAEAVRRQQSLLASHNDRLLASHTDGLLLQQQTLLNHRDDLRLLQQGQSLGLSPFVRGEPAYSMTTDVSNKYPNTGLPQPPSS